MDSANQKVAVLGGGIIGVCCALSLLAKGKRVQLVDEGELKRKASYGNAGVISPWSCVPQSMPGIWRQIPGWLLNKNGPVSFQWTYLSKLLPWSIKFLAAGKKSKVLQISNAMDALNRPNLEIYRQHLTNTGHEDLIKDSCYLHLYRNALKLSPLSLDYQLRSDNQAPVSIINAQQIKELEPAISGEYMSALLIKSQARAVSPGQLVDVLTEKFRQGGGELVKTQVKEIHPDNRSGWTLSAQGNTISCEQLVVAAGTWSVNLLKPLRLKFPLINERGYHLEFHDPNVSLNHSVMDVSTKFVCSSMSAGIRSAGTAEFAAIKAKPDYQRAKMLAQQTKRMLPDLNISQTSEWMGNRPSFPDSLPVIDKVSEFNGLYLAFGHSHYGLAMAPKTGQILAGLVAGVPTDTNLEPYRYNRFA